MRPSPCDRTLRAGDTTLRSSRDSDTLFHPLTPAIGCTPQDQLHLGESASHRLDEADKKYTAHNPHLGTAHLHQKKGKNEQIPVKGSY